MRRRSEVPQNLILDTGFWIGLYNERDEHHEKAVEFALLFDYCNLLIPWPSLYETLNSGFVMRSALLHRFELLLDRPGTLRLSDELYREQALVNVSLLNRGRGRRARGISLVDIIIRAMIEDVNIKIDALITFNRPDFLEVCLSRRV